MGCSNTSEIEEKDIEKILYKVDYNGTKENGYLCRIPFPDSNNLLPLLIISNNIFGDSNYKNSNLILTDNKKNNKTIKLDEERMVYFNKDENNNEITIIEIKEEDGVDLNQFLNITETYSNKAYNLVLNPKLKSIDKIKAEITNISENQPEIEYKCNVKAGTEIPYGSPIIDLDNYQIIAFHKRIDQDKNINIAHLFNNMINEFREEQVKKYKYQIEILYFNKDEKEIRIFGDKFVENNRSKCKIIVDGKMKDLCTHLTNKSVKIENYSFSIKLVIFYPFTDLSYMFSECSYLLYLPEIQNLKTNYVTNLSYMFNSCKSLESFPDISIWNTNKVTSLKSLFNGCSSLLSLPDISKWNTSKVINMDLLFENCTKLKKLPYISNWDTSKVNSMFRMFNECNSLSQIPDISKWDISNVTNLCAMFNKCISLNSLPDISKWNTSNVTIMSGMFMECLSLTEIPDISIWNTSNVSEIFCLFQQCSKLTYIPDISKWNTKKFTDITAIFKGCSKLKSLPDISKWNTSNVIH